MRIFVTGATGFIGSHVLAGLCGTGCTVAALIRPNASTKRIQSFLGRVTVINGDLERQADFLEPLRAFKPDVVIHLGWDGVGNVSRNDLGQVRNVSTTVELVKSAAQSGARHFVGLGSQAEYGPCTDRIFEDQSTAPTTLYGATKLASYHLSRALSAHLGMRFAWLRLFSSYGPGDNPTWLIPSLIQKLRNGGKPALTRCEQLWDFLYVEDAADAVIQVALNEHAKGAFNLASGSARPLREIVETIRNSVAPNASLGFGEIAYRPDQVMRLEADIGRLSQATGWRPHTSLSEGIRLTMDSFGKS